MITNPESGGTLLATAAHILVAENPGRALILLSFVTLVALTTAAALLRCQRAVRSDKNSYERPCYESPTNLSAMQFGQLRGPQSRAARWQHALESAQIGVFDIDLQTGNSVTSEGWFRLMGLHEADELLDPQAHFLSRVHPEDLKRLEEADCDCIKGLTDRSICEFRVLFPDGSWRWMRSDAVVAARDGDGQALRLIGTQMDITPFHETKEYHRRGEEKLKMVLANAPVGMALISTDGAVHFANKAMAEIAQCQQQEIVAHGLSGIFIGRGPDEIKDAISQIHARKRNAFRTEQLLLRRDGSAIWAIVSLAPIGLDIEHRDEFVLLVQDITDKKEIEKLRANFFATVSHEMRTPVAAINGALALVAGAFSNELGDESRKLIDISIMNSNRLVALVNDTLDLEKISDDSVDFNFSNESLGEIIDAAVRQIEPYASKYYVLIKASMHDKDCMVKTDRRRLEQVISNLLSNACKFSKPNGVVRIATNACDPNTVSISVKDEGVGIPESFRAKIFEPFSQGHLDHLHSKQGSGLGLSIARKIVIGMGGEISFQSKPGQGTVFCFTCSIAQPAPTNLVN